MPYFTHNTKSLTTESERKSYTNRVFNGEVLAFTYEVQAVGPAAARITNMNAVAGHAIGINSIRSIKEWMFNEGFTSCTYERKQGDGTLLIKRIDGNA
jgi:hypothetical protein